MANKGPKTSQVTTVVAADSVTFVQQKRNAAGGWDTVDSFAVQCADVPDSLENGDSFASMKSYGIRAFLLDRASQFREHGEAAYMQAMRDHYKETLAVGIYKAKRASTGKASGAVDSLLAMAVAELRGMPLAQAQGALKAISAEQRKALAAQPAVVAKVAELRGQQAAGAAMAQDLLASFGEEA